MFQKPAVTPEEVQHPSSQWYNRWGAGFNGHHLVVHFLMLLLFFLFKVHLSSFLDTLDECQAVDRMKVLKAADWGLIQSGTLFPC